MRLGITTRLSLAIGLLTLLAASTASAIYLDENREIAVRARIYSQAALRTQGSQTDTIPETNSGDLVQHRNFYNPEVDAKLTRYLKWMRGAGLGFLQPDEFGFRIAGWGFYDGVYDYGSSQFGDHLDEINPYYPDPVSQGAFYLEGDNFNCPERVNGDPRTPGLAGTCVAGRDPNNGRAVSIASLNKLYPGHELKKPRDIYAHQARVNELYLDYTKGPFFVRAGRQAISWGEADTIALLDQNNPFDITRGPPGAFQDLDEARIPLWTLRTSLELPLDSEMFTSGLLEAYWVPGDIDTNTGIFPMLTASPYSPRGIDPQEIIKQFNGQAQFVLFDHTPKRKMSNSRFGFRFQTVIGGNHTFSAWYYNHFPNAAVPRSLGMSRVLREDGVTTTRVYTVEAVHKLCSVYGVSDSFFVEPVDSVSQFATENPWIGWAVRMFSPFDAIWRFEAEYFENEASFVPQKNLGAGAVSAEGVPLDNLKQLEWVGTVPVADILRWEIGSDRNIFFRPLNPTNSFLFVTSMVGAWNITETTTRQDFRMSGQRKPGTLGTEPDDFTQLKEVELFGQMRLQTSYMHGKLEPGVTLIVNARRTTTLLPEVNYRINDSLLFGIRYVFIAGAYEQLGFYRDRDQISARLTYQLN